MLDPCTRSILACAALIAALLGDAAGQALPSPPTPPENPTTDAKRVLGKLLFWEEQLSSDDTMACGTCHIPAFAGTDPRLGRHPGPDRQPMTLDDKLGSPGMLRSDASGDYVPDAVFGFSPQVTFRAANAVPMSAFAPELFWDGHAGGTFTDPETATVAIQSGGALESQAVVPVLSPVEMGHEGRSWSDVTEKLRRVRPMALAKNLPPDMAQALVAHPTYPELFTAAFGTSQITAVRIAFALATYERTLIPDDTPFDRFQAGQPGAMTPNQVRGLKAFRSFTSVCTVCHPEPLFTDQSFRNDGVRPWQEDPGRMNVTGSFFERGEFKVPSLRNVGLKRSFMHNGGVVAANMTSVRDVIDFYRETNGHTQFPENRDPELSILNIPEGGVGPLVDFLENALTDPRAALETFPFDRPTLFSEGAPNPAILGAGTPGQGGFVPQLIARTPPLRGSRNFKLGVHAGLGGAQAWVRVSNTPPGQTGLTIQSLPMTLNGTGPGEGYATWHWNIPDLAAPGSVLYLQWIVTDPAAANGFASSAVARITLL